MILHHYEYRIWKRLLLLSVLFVTMGLGWRFLVAVQPIRLQPTKIPKRGIYHHIQRIGLREDLQERPIFKGRIYAFLYIFPFSPIHWHYLRCDQDGSTHPLGHVAMRSPQEFGRGNVGLTFWSFGLSLLGRQIWPINLGDFLDFAMVFRHDWHALRFRTRWPDHQKNITKNCQGHHNCSNGVSWLCKGHSIHGIHRSVAPFSIQCSGFVIPVIPIWAVPKKYPTGIFFQGLYGYIFIHVYKYA